MNCKRLSTTTRGLSLVEILVSSGIFLLLSTSLLALLSQNQKVSEKNIDSADSTSSLLLLVEKCRQELKSARVIGGTPHSTPPSGVVGALESLDYWIYQRNGASPVFDTDGRLVFLPGVGSDPDVATIKLEGERLVRDFQGDKKMLVSLGRDGEIAFKWQPALKFVKVFGQLESPFNKTDVRQLRSFSFFVALNNVE